jgi:spermidine/putrescine transport system permease protein
VEAARDLYSTPRQVFRKVILPLSIPGIFAGFLLTFIPAVGDYVNNDILGGPNTTMIGNVIQREFPEATRTTRSPRRSRSSSGRLLIGS